MPGITNVEQLHQHREERHEPGGRTIIIEPDRREIIRDNDRVIIRHDEFERLRRWGPQRVERRGGEVYEVVERPEGYEIVSVRDDSGRLLRRYRRYHDGREVILIENRPGQPVFLDIPPPVITIPRNEYIVDISDAPPPRIYETLEAPPLVPVDRAYTLDEIRYNVGLRDRMRRIDVDTITFATGSWEISPDQGARLEAIATAMREIISRDPREIFLIEGHTDAVGNDVDNLSLSDRRAASVAAILTEVYQIPPENLVTQGYGEQFLKIPTSGPSRENRRVTVRRITPLLVGSR